MCSKPRNTLPLRHLCCDTGRSSCFPELDHTITCLRTIQSIYFLRTSGRFGISKTFQWILLLDAGSNDSILD